MNKKLKKFVVIPVVIILVIIASVILIPKLSRDKTNSPGGNRQQGPVLADGYIIREHVLENKIKTTGNIIPNEEVEVRSEVSRRLTGIHFREGTFVSRGKLLFTLDNSELYAQLKKLKIQEDLSVKKIERDEKLRERGLIPEEEYEISLNELEHIRADIELLSVQISKTFIRAPFSGIIGLRNVSRGSFVTPNDILTTIQDLSQVKIDFSIPERYSSQLKKGQNIKFTIESSENKFIAEIYASEPSIDLNTRSVIIRAITRNTSGELKPGTFANVTFELNPVKDAMLIPYQALIPKLQGHEVYILKDGKAKPFEVEIGTRTDEEVQIISPEINPGDTLLITNILRLRPGAEVKIVNVN